MEGCEVQSSGATSVTCRCSHLTAFAALLPQRVLEVSSCMSIYMSIYMCMHLHGQLLFGMCDNVFTLFSC